MNETITPGSDEIPGDQTVKSKPLAPENVEQEKELGAVTPPEADLGPIVNTPPPADLEAKVAEITGEGLPATTSIPPVSSDVTPEPKKRNFGWALAQMREGAHLRRNDWPADFFYVYYREGFVNPSPDLCQDQIMLVRGEHHIVWINGPATSSDLLANDWIIAE